MTHTVVWRRFRSLLFASVILSGVDYVAGMMECIIGGSLLGGQAVAGLTLLAPIMPLLTFIGLLIVSGSMTLYAYAGGQADEEEMNRVYSQAVILCAVVGVLLTILMVASKNSILSYWDVSADVAAYASEYYDGVAWRPAVYFVSQILLSLLLAEGEVKRSVVAAVTQFSVTVAAALFLVPRIGILGLSLGTTLGFVADCFAKGSFLFSERCPIRLSFWLSAGKIMEMLRTSFGMALANLWIAILPFAMTSYLLSAFGEEVLIVFGVINSILGVAIAIFEGVEQAMQPMVCMYYSEGNLRGMEKTMKIGAGSAALLGASLSVLFLAMSGVLPGWFGAEDETTATMARAAMAAFLPFLALRALGMVYAAYFAYTGRIVSALTLQGLLHLALPFLCAVLGGQLFGLTGAWIGLGASGLLALGADWIVSRLAAQRNPNLEGILMLDGRQLENQLSYDCMSVEDEVMATAKQAERDLIAFGLPEDKCRLAGFFIEELGMNAVERAEGHAPFEVETTLCREEDTITLIVRDNGKVQPGALSADITNPDLGLESFRMYVVSQVASKLDSRSYIMIGGENRTALRLK